MNQNNYPNFYKITIKQLIITTLCASVLISPISLYAMNTRPMDTSADGDTKESMEEFADSNFDAYCATVQAAHGPGTVAGTTPHSMALEYSTNIYPPHLGNIAADTAEVSASAHAHPYPDPAYDNADAARADARATAYTPTIYPPYQGNLAATAYTPTIYPPYPGNLAANAYTPTIYPPYLGNLATTAYTPTIYPPYLGNLAANAAQAYTHAFNTPPSITQRHEALSTESSHYAQLAAATPVSGIGAHAPYYPSLAHALTHAAATSVSRSNEHDLHGLPSANTNRESSESDNNQQHELSPYPPAKRQKTTPKKSNRDLHEEIADVLAEELARERQHRPNKPKRELISESASYNRKKKPNPSELENNILHRAIVANKESMQTALIKKNHKLVRKLAEDPVTRAAWHLMKDSAKNNLLIIAIYNDDLQSMKALVENGFDINMPSHTKQSLTPLVAAFQKGNDTIIQYLLNHGATLHLHPHTLLAAISGCSAYGIDYLLAAGIDYSTISCELAFNSDHMPLIERVLAPHISPDNREQSRLFIQQNQLLNSAIAHANIPLINMLLPYCDDTITSSVNIVESLHKAIVHNARKCRINLDDTRDSMHWQLRRNSNPIEQHNIMRVLTTAYCCIATIPTLITNGIGSTADYNNFGAALSKTNEDAINIILIHHAHLPTYKLLLAEIRKQNHSLLVIAKRLVKLSLEARYEELALVKTEGDNPFDKPELCSLISEYEAPCLYPYAGSLLEHIRPIHARVMHIKY